MQTFQAALTDIKTYEDGVLLLRFAPPPGSVFSFKPGQYAILTVPHEKEPVKRLYSLASPPNDAYFELLIKPVPGGAASSYIQTLTAGSSVEMQGPAGLFELQNTPKTKVFLSTGTGYAPMRSFILSTPHHTQNYYLFWGMPTFRTTYLVDELISLSLHDPLFHPKVCLSREASIEAVPETMRAYFSLGHVNDCLAPLISSQPQNSLEFYVCGHREVTESLREYLYNLQIDPKMVFFERY